MNSIFPDDKSSLILPGYISRKKNAVPWPRTDALLQAKTGYATSASSLWVFDGLGPYDDYIGGNDISITDTDGITENVQDPDFGRCLDTGADASTGAAGAGDVYDCTDNQAGSITIVGCFKCLSLPAGIRTIFGKSNGGGASSDYYELRINNGSFLTAWMQEGGITRVSNRSETEFTDGSVVWFMYKIDRTADVIFLDTNLGDGPVTDISAVSDISNSFPFEVVNGRTFNAPVRLGMMALYTGSAAEGFTQTHRANLQSALGF